jgi:hypothetical protein
VAVNRIDLQHLIQVSDPHDGLHLGGHIRKSQGLAPGPSLAQPFHQQGDTRTVGTLHTGKVDVQWRLLTKYSHKVTTD